MDGFKLVDKIRNFDTKTPIVVISGNEEVKNKIVMNGPSKNYRSLLKPVTSDDLLEVLGFYQNLN